MIRLLIGALLITFVGYSLWSTFEEDVPASALEVVEPMASEISKELAPALDTAKRATQDTLKVVEGATGDAKAGLRRVQSVGAQALDEGTQAPGDAGMDWYKDGGG